MKRWITALAVTTAIVAPPQIALAHTALPIGFVNVRQGPGTEYPVLTTLGPSDAAAVLGHDGSWLKVRTPGGTVGYMADWVTRELFDDEVRYMQVNTDVLNLRAGPGLEQTITGQMGMGERYRALEGVGGWLMLDAGYRGKGWASADYLVRSVPPPATQPPATPPPERFDPVEDSLGLRKGVISTRATGIYSGRDTRFARLAEVPAWTVLTYMGSSEGWVLVRNAAGTRGWVEGSQVQLMDSAPEFAYQATYSVQEDDWSMRFAPVRAVVPGGDGLRLREGASTQSGVLRYLAAGERMKLLSVPGGEFVQVMLEDGASGWVSRNWIRPVGGVPTETLGLTSPARGVLRLEVVGSTGAPTALDERTLVIPLPELQSRRAALQIAQHQIQEVQLTPTAAVVRFAGRFAFQTQTGAGGSSVVELRPQVERVEAITGTDRTVYRFHTAGAVYPELRQARGGTLLSIPGGRLARDVKIPAALWGAEDSDGLQVLVQSDRPAQIRLAPDHVDVILPEPGLKGKTIVLDPGHGGAETGAIGKNGLTEKSVNLDVALRLKALLEAEGAKVVMTRTGDERCVDPADLKGIPASEHLRRDLQCRAELSDRAGADLFLSIHSNSHENGRELGTETYWTQENLNALRSSGLASLVQKELVGALSRPDRGAKAEMFYVIKYAQAPAALAEVAFVGTPAEEALLGQPSFRQKAADGLYRALRQFFS